MLGHDATVGISSNLLYPAPAGNSRPGSCWILLWLSPVALVCLETGTRTIDADIA